MKELEDVKSKIPCCPTVEMKEHCDILEFTYRLSHPTTIDHNKKTQRVVPVEIAIRARLKRCTGGLELGDLAYTTTLFPGEKVRLFTTDRRNRFIYDSSSKMSYRYEQTQEEQYYMASMSRFMSDLSIRESGQSGAFSWGSADASGSASGALEALFLGPDVEAEGSYSTSSIHTFIRELSQHASSSSFRSEVATRVANSVSIGEVQTRSHKEGETSDHFESSSREFSNLNKCHSVTYYFYRLNKKQIITFEIVAITTRVIEEGAKTKVTSNPYLPTGGVSVVPYTILATDENRLKKEAMARESVVLHASSSVLSPAALNVPLTGKVVYKQTALITQTLDDKDKRAAMKAALDDLVAEGVLDANYAPSAEIRKLGFRVETSLPTPGFVVKGCLDECGVCDAERQQEIAIELERRRLENEKLKQLISLMEKDQEHRCCPAPPAPPPV